MKIITFRFKFHSCLYPWFQLTIGSDNSLVPNRRQTMVYPNDGIFYRHIYAWWFILQICIKPHRKLGCENIDLKIRCSVAMTQDDIVSCGRAACE